MYLPWEQSVDVLVIGSGIAGTTAALAAAESGARVLVASAGKTFSGASFFGGTWGLGLVGPEDSADEREMEQTILEVGGGVADPSLVHALVSGVGPAIEGLKRSGVSLREPDDPDQREFIPCFDHKRRSWHGIEREPYRRTVSRLLAERDVTTLPRTVLVDLVVDGQDEVGEGSSGGRVVGAALASRDDGRVFLVRCGSVVLATGGVGALYGRRLTAPDALGSAHSVAAGHGARFTNLEFIQVMPTIVWPVSDVVFNEKTFRYLEGVGTGGLACGGDLLEARSGHGPFTASRPSRAVDLAIDAAGPEGLPVRYAGLPDPLPEFVDTYFAWLSGRGVNPGDELRISHGAHASNGGLLIDASARCVGGPDGLYACGECTGGMHGADRLGGLSTANCLVFGGIAGKAAAECALGAPEVGDQGELWLEETFSPAAPAAAARVASLLDEGCLVRRDETGLRRTLAGLEGLADALGRGLSPTADPRPVLAQALARQRVATAQAMVTAMLERTESLGSHFRDDDPGDPGGRLD